MSPARLTIGQVIRLCGQSIGRLRTDHTFPLMQQGTFDETAVLA